MKRAISPIEALWAGLLRGEPYTPVWRWERLRVMDPLPNPGNYVLYRSPARLYRKACRMLRRSGRRVRRDRMLRKLAPELYARHEMAKPMEPGTFTGIDLASGPDETVVYVIGRDGPVKMAGQNTWHETLEATPCRWT